MKKKCDNERPDPKLATPDPRLATPKSETITKEFSQWLRGVCVCVHLCMMSGASWAKCDVEVQRLQAARQKMNITNWNASSDRAALEEKYRTSTRGYLEMYLKDAQALYKQWGSGTSTNPNDAVWAAGANLQICLIKHAQSNATAIKSGSSGTSDQALPRSAQQQAQQNAPTGPRENCEALFTPERLKSLPGPQYVQEHIDCLNRNLARSKTQTTTASTAFTPQDTQQQSQQAQQLTVQSYARADQALQSQSRADQARQGKRKTHDPAAEAHECIDVDTQTLYGGFKNKCSYAVSYGYCVDNPKKGAWTNSPLFSCAGLTGVTAVGGQDIRANGYDANHTKGGDSVYYFACKQPATAMDLTFIPGQGIQGRCGNLMGN